MAWALHYTASARSDFTDISLTGDFTITFRIKFDTMAGNQFILGSDNTTSTWIGWFNGSMTARVGGASANIATDPLADVWYDFTLDRVGSTITFSETTLGSANVTSTASAPFNQIARFSTRDDWTFQGLLENLTVAGTSNIAWSPDASDHSGSTDQPIITDTVGGNDATGVGFPSFDASVWVNLGGGELNITVPLIEGTPEVFAPTVTLAQFVDLPLIISEELTYQPTIQLGGQLLELDIVPSETEVLELTILQELQLELSLTDGETFVHKPMLTGGEPVVVISNFIAPLISTLVKPLTSRVSA